MLRLDPANEPHWSVRLECLYTVANVATLGSHDQVNHAFACLISAEQATSKFIIPYLRVLENCLFRTNKNDKVTQ